MKSLEIWKKKKNILSDFTCFKGLQAKETGNQKSAKSVTALEKSMLKSIISRIHISTLLFNIRASEI